MGGDGETGGVVGLGGGVGIREEEKEEELTTEGNGEGGGEGTQWETRAGAWGNPKRQARETSSCLTPCLR